MDKDTADLQKITDTLADRELDAGQIAVEAQLPVLRVVRLLGPRCVVGGPYSRRDVNGVYEYSLRPVAPPSEPPSSVLSAEEQALINRKYMLTRLLIADGAPNAVVMAVRVGNFALIKDYVARQRAQVKKEEADLAARANRVGQLEDILNAVKT